MSSILKKGKTFIPKIKKPVKKKPASKLSTNQASTQENATPAQARTEHVVGHRHEEDEQSPQDQASKIQLATPPSTQVDPHTPNPQFHFGKSISNVSASTATRHEEAVDPTDKAKVVDSAVADTSDEEEGEKQEEERDDDNEGRRGADANKIGQAASRRVSVSQRRLSGINQVGYRSRSASVSLKPNDEALPSTKIIVPQTKRAKRRLSTSRQLRRRSSTTRRSSTASAAAAPSAKPSTAKSSKVIAPAAAAVPVPINSDQQAEQEINDQSLEQGWDREKVSDTYVLGIDPATNKVRKFRRKNARKAVCVKHADGFMRAEDITLDDIIPEEPDNLITTVTDVSQIPRNIKEEDLDLYSELNYQYEEMTMADLCKPTLKIGQVSSNFQLVQEAEREIKQRKIQRRLDRERARQERIPLEEAILRNEGKSEDEIKAEQLANNGKSKSTDISQLEYDDEPAASSALQLTLVDGKIGYSEESAVVVKQRADTSNRTVEQANPFANPVMSSTYGKQTNNDKWTAVELHEFYKALSMFGTDFSLISQMFPHRTRKQVKAKFALEERKYPEVIELALRRKLPVDFAEYCKNVNNEFKTIEQYNEDLKRVRLEHEENMNAIAIEREKAFREDAEASRKREIEIRTGTKPMTRAEKMRELRKNETVLGSIDDIKRQREDIGVPAT
ncbi:uncharacterized protein LODBEIA_P09070 [Lodderomyces beijingensis]|uniref:SANT domain-containing protein n=1 Tax=Lodderomyces beijingensis TaxID=1775926 RepID=A0ABP0ZEU9_9ASCO